MHNLYPGLGFQSEETHGPEATAESSPQERFGQRLQSGDGRTSGAGVPTAQTPRRRAAGAYHPDPPTSLGYSRLLSRLGAVADRPHRRALERSALYADRQCQRGDRPLTFPRSALDSWRSPRASQGPQPSPSETEVASKPNY